MTPIGGIADGGSIPPISTISNLTTALPGRHSMDPATGNVTSQITYDGDVTGFDVVSKERTMARQRKPTLMVTNTIIDDLFIDIDALELAIA